MLGVETVLGSAIVDRDDVSPGTGGSRGPVAVLSHGAWMRRFGGQSSVLGSRILINGDRSRLSDSAQGFKGAESASAGRVAPMMMQPVLHLRWAPPSASPGATRSGSWDACGAHVDVRQAEAELPRSCKRQQAILESPDVARFGGRRQNVLDRRSRSFLAMPGFSVRQRYSQPLSVLMTVMGMVLLIACADVASLC